MTSRLPLAVAGACALALSACFISTNDNVNPGPPPTGSVVLRWSINGAFDPNLCYQSSASTTYIDVYFMDGTLQGEYVAPCTDFKTSIDLPPNRYYATADLEGANGARTTAVNIDPFTIIGGSTIVIDVDFPPSSFY